MLQSSSSQQTQPDHADLSETDTPSSALSEKISAIFQTQSGLMASADGVRVLMENFENDEFMSAILKSPTIAMTLLECLAHREFEGIDKDVGRTAVREFLTTPLVVWNLFNNLGADKEKWNEMAARLFDVMENMDCHGVTAILCAPSVAKSFAFFHQSEKLGVFLEKLPANCLERLSNCDEFSAIASRHGILGSSPSFG